MRENKYEVLRNVWKMIAVPSLMRGLDVMPCTLGDCDRMPSVSPGDASHFRAKFTLQHYHGETINGRNL